MAGSDENNPGVIGPSHLQGGLRAGGGGKFVVATGRSRRALGTVNRDLVGAPPFPCIVKKRPLSVRNEVSNKIPSTHMHGPITRKFSAEMANKLQIKPQLIKKSVLPEPVPNESEDCTAINLDDEPEGGNESDIPMFKQHVEAMLEEIDRMEFEMENIDEEFLDIDNHDKNNPLAVVEFLSAHQVVRKKLQLVGITAMLIACKYEEVSVPVVEDLILISDKAYNRKELELLSFFMIELCLVECTIFTAAAAAIFTAQWTGKLTCVHRKYCTSKYGYAAKTDPATFSWSLNPSTT
ncbi:putative Plant U-Box 15 [Hibiscus syriacus]|uniref:Plant U-Box 15 n=1 Tax=Hibiscus syriacus TaxID=106335 RepID=A0A6A2XJU7_HIBSY|nr:putative Plant U-Box 15 [Hibiscus syriacus]